MASHATTRSVADNAPRPQAPAVPFQIPSNTLPPLQLRLDRNNFSYWRALVLAALRAYNLQGFILGTNPQPPETLAGTLTPNPLHEQWIHFDQYILHWLLNSISEQLLGHVIDCETSAAIWNVLIHQFATRSKARIIQIKGLLQSTKKGTMSIDEYVLKMKSFAASLAQAGEPLAEESLCLYVLGGLGPEYEATVINLTNRSETLTIQDVLFSVHNQEMRIQLQSPPPADNVQAHYAGVSGCGNG